MQTNYKRNFIYNSVYELRNNLLFYYARTVLGLPPEIFIGDIYPHIRGQEKMIRDFIDSAAGIYNIQRTQTFSHKGTGIRIQLCYSFQTMPIAEVMETMMENTEVGRELETYLDRFVLLQDEYRPAMSIVANALCETRLTMAQWITKAPILGGFITNDTTYVGHPNPSGRVRNVSSDILDAIQKLNVVLTTLKLANIDTLKERRLLKEFILLKVNDGTRNT